MTESREDPTVRVALGGPLRAAEDGAVLLADAREVSFRGRGRGRDRVDAADRPEYGLVIG